jgi:hypothetical protein
LDMFGEIAWKGKQKEAKVAWEAGAGGSSAPPAPPALPGAASAPGRAPPPPCKGQSGSGERESELQKMPQFKLKAAATVAGVPPLAIGVPPRTKDETIALILTLESAAT